MRLLSLLVLAALGLLLWSHAAWRRPPVALENRSGRALRSVEYRVGTQTLAAEGLAPGDLTRHALPMRREGPLFLRVVFLDGESVELPAGWYSPGQTGMPRLVLVSVDSLRVEPARPR